MADNLIRDSIGWDAYNWGRGIEFWNKFIDFTNKRVLELGCGCDNGGLSLWAALNKASEIICSDYNFPTESTQKIHQLYGIQNIIRYEQISALEIPYENHFDVIMFKSMLGGISRNDEKKAATVLKQCLKALKPNGALIFAENLVSSNLHMLCRKYFLKRTWRYFKNCELKTMLKENGFNILESKLIGVSACFGRSEKQRFLLGKIDKFILEKFLPEETRYIEFIIAQKNN